MAVCCLVAVATAVSSSMTRWICVPVLLLRVILWKIFFYQQCWTMVVRRSLQVGRIKLLQCIRHIVASPCIRSWGMEIRLIVWRGPVPGRSVPVVVRINRSRSGRLRRHPICCQLPVVKVSSILLQILFNQLYIPGTPMAVSEYIPWPRARLPLRRSRALLITRSIVLVCCLIVIKLWFPALKDPQSTLWTWKWTSP